MASELDGVTPSFRIDEKEFKFEELADSVSVITVVGDKNSGKTALTYMLNGEKWYLSLDKKSKRPAMALSHFSDLKNIHVLPAGKYYLDVKDLDLVNLTPEKKDELMRRFQESAIKTYTYTIWLIEQFAKRGVEVDYLIFDGSEILSKCCEQMMRYYNKLLPTQGIANQNLWKERNVFWDAVYQKAVAIAKPKKAVIFTTYYTTIETDVRDGQVLAKEKQPAWYGNMKLETDVTLRTYSITGKDGHKVFRCKIDSKLKAFPDGADIDLTNKSTFKEALQGAVK